MPAHTLKKTITPIIAISFVFSGLAVCFAYQAPKDVDADLGEVSAPINYNIDKDIEKNIRRQQKITRKQENEYSEFQITARAYREQAVEYQKAGNYQTALAYYQKAADLDPGYTVVYNDLGIIYEALDMPDRAEDSYKKAIKADPNYLSAYSNLALFYENKRDFPRAAGYWKKRVLLGIPDDPWTIKAQKRLDDILLVLGDKKIVENDEDSVLGLMHDVLVKKEILKSDSKSQSREYFETAKLYYKKGKEVEALKAAVDAKSLDPSNTEIDDFIDKIQRRLLSK